jgi:hypothetical protein
MFFLAGTNNQKWVQHFILLDEIIDKDRVCRGSALGLRWLALERIEASQSGIPSRD